MGNDRTSISSLLNGESDGETFFANEVLDVLKTPEINAVFSDALDQHIGSIERSPSINSLSEVDAQMDIDDLEILRKFLREESEQVPYSYHGGRGFLWANAVSPDHLDKNQRIELEENNTRFSPAKQVSFGIIAHRPDNNQERNLEKPKYSVILRNVDVFHDLDSRRIKYSPTIGIEVQVFPDGSIQTIPTKYSAEITYRADEETMDFASNHPFAERIDTAVNNLKR